MYPIIITGKGKTVFLHAYYHPKLLAQEAAAMLNGDTKAVVLVKDDSGITLEGLTLVAKEEPLTTVQLERWAEEYNRRRNG